MRSMRDIMENLKDYDFGRRDRPLEHAVRQIFKAEKQFIAGHQWVTPIVLATWEAEVKRIEVPGESRQIFVPELQNNQSKMDWRRGSSSRVPEFKFQSHIN
jgi:hypothetical protein